MWRRVGMVVCLMLLLPLAEGFPASKQGAAKKEPAKAQPPQAEQPTPPQQPQQTPQLPPPQPQADIWIGGKLFASLKRNVAMPFQGIVTQWRAQPGQRVKAGDSLARFRLAPEAALQLRRRAAAPQLKDLETQIAVLEKQLDPLQVKHRELSMLAQQNMATAESVAQMEREIQLLNRQRSILQERFGVERGLQQEDQSVLRKLLGTLGESGHIPDEVPLSAPINGLVIWVNPDVREGAELAPGAVVAIVAVMNPMRVRTSVHEIEAVKLKVGDPAELSLESLPGQKFPAKLALIQWTTATPAPGDPTYYDVEFEVANPDGVLKEGLKGVILVRPGR